MSNSNILHINPEFTSLFGYTEEEIMGKNIDEVLTKNERIKMLKNSRMRSIPGGAFLPRLAEEKKMELRYPYLF